MSCSDCFSGTSNSGNVTGTVETLHGLPAYVANPPTGDSKGIIVVIPDVFGWSPVNGRLLCDEYAAGGFKVLMPDFMNGSELSEDVLRAMEVTEDPKASFFSKMPAFGTMLTNAPSFLYKNRAAVTVPRIDGFFRALRASTDLPIGAAGFCWGGFHVFRLASGKDKTDDGKPLCDAFFTAHPSMLTLPADAEAVTLPVSVAHGGADSHLKDDKVEMIRTNFQRKTKEGIDCELEVYPGAKHGFAIRGDRANEKQLKDLLAAKDQAVRFFTKHLAGSSKTESKL